MRLLFSKYANVYNSNRNFFWNLNFYENTTINSLNDLSHIIYYLFWKFKIIKKDLALFWLFN